MPVEVKLKVRCPQDGLSRVYGNPMELEIALKMLLQNAVEAVADSGRPVVGIRSRMRSDGFVEIQIAGRGIGMDEATVKQCFVPFFSTKKARGGTGLGMAVAKGIIVARHHGEIDINSKPGKGTIVTVTLPTAEGGEDA